MRKLTISTFILLVTASFAFAQTDKGLKVFISVDMEGIAGVVHGEEVSRGGKDYNYFRMIMTKETNAAIEGAIGAGANEILVRDSHDSARNILPEELDKRARLLRAWSGSEKSMMEGIDETFDAVVFIGYHAKAGTSNAILDHTMSGSKIANVSVNGFSLPEAGINALIAGYYDVPVVFLSGDKAICEQVKELLYNIETVSVKEGIGDAALCLHPEVAWERIRHGVKKSLENLSGYKPYKLTPPYTLVVTFKNNTLVHHGSLYPGVERSGDWELTYTSDDLSHVLRVLYWMLNL